MNVDELPDDIQRGSLERAVHDALATPLRGDAAARVLTRIGGRSPRLVRQAIADRRLRVATGVAALLLASLVTLTDGARRPGIEPTQVLAETQLSAVVVLDTADLDGRATPGRLFADLFDVEVPE